MNGHAGLPPQLRPQVARWPGRAPLSLLEDSMRKARTPLFLTAMVLILGSVALAAAGIEVLSITPVGDGYLVESLTHGVPAGSHMEAVIYIDGNPIVVDCAPIVPGSGHSVVFFPPVPEGANHTLVARGPNGDVLFSVPVSTAIGVEGILEAD